ncbi:MAG: hypothetical protein U0931_16750 [Vulcanimicrobiota bacterium]
MNLPHRESSAEDKEREAEAVRQREERRQAFLQMQEAQRQERERWTQTQRERAEANREQRLRVWGGPLRPRSEYWVELPEAQQQHLKAYYWLSQTWLQAGATCLGLGGGKDFQVPECSRIRPEAAARLIDAYPRLEYDLGDGRSLWNYRFWHKAGSAGGPRDSVRNQFVLYDGHHWTNLIGAGDRMGHVEGARWRLFASEKKAVLRVTIDACEGLDITELFDFHFIFDLKAATFVAQEKSPTLGAEIAPVARVGLGDKEKLSPVPWPVEDSQGQPWLSTDTTRLALHGQELLGLGLTSSSVQVLHWRIPTGA